MKLLYEQKERYVFRKTRHLAFAPHLHDAVEMVCLLRGESTFIHGNERTRLQAGDLFISFPNQIHGYCEDSPDLEHYIMILPTQTCLSAYRKVLSEKVPAQPFLKKGSWENTGLLSLLQMAFADKDSATPEIMQGYFQLIIGKTLERLTLQDADSASEDALRAILMYIGDHYTQNLSRSQIAKAVGYNESYISHLFSQTLKTTLPDYIHSLRLDDALRLLARTDMTVTAIALELGFGSLRNFNRVFLKNYGITPSRYRQKQVTLQLTVDS